MNLPTLPRLESVEEMAMDIVASVLNEAKESLGIRQTLKQLAYTRTRLASTSKVVLTHVRCPLATTCERLIDSTIRLTWKLTSTFQYLLKYLGTTEDECSKFFYFEVIFSQPHPYFPVPQTTASVFFRIQDKHLGPPILIFRIEGHRQEHDVRAVMLTADRILAVMMMKRKLFKRIEHIGLF